MYVVPSLVALIDTSHFNIILIKSYASASLKLWRIFDQLIFNRKESVQRNFGSFFFPPLSQLRCDNFYPPVSTPPPPHFRGQGCRDSGKLFQSSHWLLVCLLHAGPHNKNAPTYLTTLTSTINLVRAQNVPSCRNSDQYSDPPDPPRPLHRKSNKEKQKKSPFLLSFFGRLPIPFRFVCLHYQHANFDHCTSNERCWRLWIWAAAAAAGCCCCSNSQPLWHNNVDDGAAVAAKQRFDQEMSQGS